MLVQIQLVRLLVGSLVGKLLSSFCFAWYDLPTNSLTNDPTNKRTNWIWMTKRIGLNMEFQMQLLYWFGPHCAGQYKESGTSH